MAELLDAEALPSGFTYPSELLRIIELGIIHPEPWEIMLGRQLEERNSGLRQRYANRGLVPFAKRGDSDDVACFIVGDTRVHVIHDYASRGWEEREVYDSFYAWLRKAVEDLIEFDS